MMRLLDSFGYSTRIQVGTFGTRKPRNPMITSGAKCDDYIAAKEKQAPLIEMNLQIRVIEGNSSLDGANGYSSFFKMSQDFVKRRLRGYEQGVAQALRHPSVRQDTRSGCSFGYSR
jgi:hypothetical protein